MPRLTFPDDKDVAFRGGGMGSYFTSLSGVAATVFTDPGATLPADIQTLAGAAIAGSILTVDINSLLPDFLGPNDGRSLLYVRVGSGPVVPVYARDNDVLASKIDTAGVGLVKAGTALAANFGATVGTVTQGDDVRLSDARVPTAHGHPESAITGLVADLTGVMRELAYGELTANFTTASTVDVNMGLAASFTSTARPCVVLWTGLYSNTGAGGLGVFTLVDELANNIVIGSMNVVAGNQSEPFIFAKRITFPTGVAKTLTAKMRVAAGTGQVYATAPDVCGLQVLSL